MCTYNVNTDLTSGLNIPAGSEIDSISKNVRVEIAEQASQASGEIILADPVNTAEEEVSISGDGPVGLTLTKGEIANPATMTILREEISEGPNKRCNFSIRATASTAFVDPGTDVADVGAEPTIADLEIVGVEYSVAESLRRSYEVTNLVLVGSDGTPACRATFQEKGSVSIAGRGDAPVGVAAGSGGAAFKGCSVGKVVVPNFGRAQKRGDWESYTAEANHYKSVA